jgi:protein gp37
MRDKWIEWKWQEDPEAPRAWEHPERTVVIVEGLSGGALRRVDAAADAMFAVEHSDARLAVYITVETADVLAAPTVQKPWRPRHAHSIPALRIERQADLSLEALRTLAAVEAQHRALVVSPREETYLHLALCEYDLVVCRGPVGPEAWPMHPAWVRSLRDQCQEAGVAFAFLGWGSWKPISEAVPGDERAATATANVWRSREGDPNDLPLLAYRVGAERSGRTLDDVERLALPEGL